MPLVIIGFRGLLIVPPNLNLTKMFLIKDCSINCDCYNKSLEFSCLIILSALNSVLVMIKQQTEVNGIGSNLRTSYDFDYNAEIFFLLIMMQI